jgi:hypothetical protein
VSFEAGEILFDVVGAEFGAGIVAFCARAFSVEDNVAMRRAAEARDGIIKVLKMLLDMHWK